MSSAHEVLMIRDRLPVGILSLALFAVASSHPALGQSRGGDGAWSGAIVLPQINDVAPSAPTGPSDGQQAFVLGTALASTALMTANVVGARAERPNRWMGLAGLVTGGVLAVAAGDAAAEDHLESPDRELYMACVGLGIGSSITGLMTLLRPSAVPTGGRLEDPSFS
jgi:hypothetical protein